jgi:hypothetical protein
MFSVILLMCSMENGKCVSFSPPEEQFPSEQACVYFADELRYRVMTQGDDNRAVDYRCINWGVGA